MKKNSGKNKSDPVVDVYVWKYKGTKAYTFTEEPPASRVKFTKFRVKRSELEIWYSVQAEFAFLQETLECITRKILRQK